MTPKKKQQQKTTIEWNKIKKNNKSLNEIKFNKNYLNYFLKLSVF